MSTPPDPASPERQTRYGAAPSGPPTGEQTNGVAVASLVLGLVSVMCGGGAGS